MIHQLLTLTRPLVVFDTETTGVDVQTARIVELGLQVWTAEGMQKEWRSLINPLVPIPEAASKVHGITDAMVQGCQVCGLGPGMHLPLTTDHAFKPWPTFKQIAPSLAKGFTNCDFAGKNVRFDLRIFDAEMRRAGQPWSYAGSCVIDAERLEQIAVPRSLSDLYKKYTGKDLDAHHALEDVRASTDVLVGQLNMYEALPRDLDKLHELSWPGWLEPEGKFRMVDGIACFGGWGKYANQPMRAADAGYWDFILKGGFSAEIKQLAADAKMGVFP